METPDAVRVLVIGLDPYRIPGPWDPRPVAEAIDAGRRRFAESGLGVEFCLVGLDGSEDVDATVSAALRARPWECVVVGGGIRGEVPLLERVVNLVRVLAPGAWISFGQAPEETYDAAVRGLDRTS